MLRIYKKIFLVLDRREKARFILLCVMVLFMAAFDVIGVASLVPFLAVVANPEFIHTNAILSAAFEFGSFSSDRAFLIALSVAVLSIVVFGLAFKTLTIFALTRFGMMRIYSLSSRLLASYLDHDYSWFLNRNSADLSKSVLSEVEQVVGVIIIPALILLANAVVLAALIGLLLFVDPVVVTAALILLGGSYLTFFIVIRRVLDRTGAVRVAANGERYKIVSEAIGGVKDVKLRGLEASFVHRYRAPAFEFSKALSVGTIVGQAPRYVLEGLAIGGMLFVVLALLLRQDGNLGHALPVLGLFAFAGVRLLPALQQVYHSSTQLRFGTAAFNAVFDDLVRSPSITKPTAEQKTLRLTQSLQLRDVTYRYPGSASAALVSLTLDIPANTTVGLVGSSGAGKSTAVDVVLGLLVPQSGEVLVDGHPITDETRRSWQRSTGYVPQAIYLSDDTLAANIAFGIPKQNIDIAAVKRAARIANLDEFIEAELPEGYQTIVGERGVRLSGGQIQRIGIARAVYEDPDVLIFDEATSALDNITERVVMEAVHNLSGAKTILLIAHRLSTVENCDEIIFLDKGRVSARGDYQTLIRESEGFRQLAQGEVA